VGSLTKVDGGHHIIKKRSREASCLCEQDAEIGHALSWDVGYLEKGLLLPRCESGRLRETLANK
jgi:hypothetical protein